MLSPFAAVGIEADKERIAALLKELEGKDVNELIAAGSKKLASVPSGGGGGGGGAAAAGGAAAPAAAKVEEKEEEEEDAVSASAGGLWGLAGCSGALRGLLASARPLARGWECTEEVVALRECGVVRCRTWASLCSTERRATSHGPHLPPLTV